VIKAIIDLVIAFLGLIESMTRSMRRAAVNLGWGLAFMAIAALLIVASTGFFLWGLYQYFAAILSSATSALIVSLVALVLAVIAGWIANRRVS
jgi:hypothetical protein